METRESSDFRAFETEVFKELGELPYVTFHYGIPPEITSPANARSGIEILSSALFRILGVIVGGLVGYNLGKQSGIFVGVLVSAVGGIAGWFFGTFVNFLVYALASVTRYLAKEPKRRKSYKTANGLVKRQDIRRHLCPALQSASKDVWEIAKVATPMLYALAVAGTVSIPRDPVVFAALAIVIARMGVASLCADNDEK